MRSVCFVGAVIVGPRRSRLVWYPDRGRPGPALHRGRDGQRRGHAVRRLRAAATGLDDPSSSSRARRQRRDCPRDRRHLLGQGLPARRAIGQLHWNNPKLHTPERRKIWLACDEHRESLSDFLGARTSSRTSWPHEESAAGEPGSPQPGQPPIADIGRSGCRNVGSSMPCPAALPRIATTQRSASSCVGRSGAQRGAQVGLLPGEQAVADLAVGGQPDPVAVAAERPRDRGDDPDRRRAAVDQEQLGRRAAARLLGRGQHEVAAPAGRRSPRR